MKSSTKKRRKRQTRKERRKMKRMTSLILIPWVQKTKMMKKTGKELGMTVNSRRKRRRKQRKLQSKRNHPRKHNPAKERESQEGPRKTLLMLGCILLVTPSHSCPQLFPIPSHSHPLNHVASKDALQVDESDNDDGDDYLAGVSLKELGNAMECEKPVSSFIQDWELTKPKNMLWWQNQEWIPVNIFWEPS